MQSIVTSRDLSLLSENEYQKIIYDWNNTHRDYQHDKSYIQLFEEQVARTPQQIAVEYQLRQLSYQELNQAANQLARQIREHYQHHLLDITPDTLIAICLDRTLNLFIGFLAILKAGAAYVPIDPSTPCNRIRFMLQDTGSRLLLTQHDLTEKLLPSIPDKSTLLVIDTLNYQTHENANIPIHSTPQSLAYVIYTSGTTGTPKGVQITNQNIVNYYVNVLPYFNDVERIDFSTSFAFDLSITTTLVPLLCGKKIIIYSGSLRDIDQYIAHLQKYSIDFIKSTPSYLTQVFSLPQSTQIKICFVGGEKLLPTQLHFLLKHINKLYDEYGPTENTVGTLLIQKTAETSPVTNIGKAYFNHKVYVLDENRQPVKIGETGELYVGGAGLSRGYLNQSELTNARFIPNPFLTERDNTEGYTRLYQTGDLVRWLPDGNLEYLGRRDFQVKIQGYRIELNEIEHALASFPNILQCAVLLSERYTQRGLHHSLVAYYISSKHIDEQEIILHLQQWLPEYMLPHRFIGLATFPLTINGKVDREALLQYESNPQDNDYHPPKTALEQELCHCWQEVLGIARVGILDDFFKLGGDSIQCMQVMARLLQKGIDCRVRDIYTHRSIQQLALVVGKKRAIVAESGVLTGEVPLLPIQSWFFEQEFEKIDHWNQSFLVRVPPLSLDRLQEILPQLIDRHDILRACFTRLPNGTRQQCYGAPIIALEIKRLDISTLSQSDQACQIAFSSWQQEFNIEQGPLWQVGYVTGYADGSARLYFAFHHLIIDSVSWRIIVEDIKRLYAGETLSEKGSSYRQWSNIIHQYTKKYAEETLYWNNQTLPNTTYLHHLGRTRFDAAFTLQTTLTEQLIGVANDAYHTEINDLLLTALGLTLSSYFKTASHRIMLEGHGREDIDENINISHTVGWFTSLYPIILTVTEEIKTSISLIKEYLRSIPNKGLGYGALRYIDSPNHESIQSPGITFNYLGQFDQASGYWQIVNEPSGETVHPKNKRPHVLDITGCVIDGRLHFSLSSYVTQEACTQIASIFENQLITLTTHCMSRIQRGLTLFTPSDFKSVTLSEKLLHQLQQNQNRIEAIYPANSLQQGFIYHAITQPNDPAYRVQQLLDYYHPLNIAFYNDAWNLAIAAHPILRTYFNWDESVIQIVSKKSEIIIQIHDLTNTLEKEKNLSLIQEKDRLIGFDLTKPTLLRLNLIQFDSSHYVLLLTAHHSILDGWSTAILINYVHQYYAALMRNEKPAVCIDKSYLEAQTYIANHRNIAIQYWSDQLQQVTHINNINALLSDSINLDSIKTVNTPRELINHENGNIYKRLKQCAHEQGLTLNTLVQFAWHKLIQIYTGDQQTIVGTTVSGRTIPIPNSDKSIGLYINTLPLIITWDASNSVLKQLHLFESQLSSLNEHCTIELAGLQKDGDRLFHSLYIAEYHDIPSSYDNLEGVITFKSRGTTETLDYPLALVVYDNLDTLQLKLKYDGKTLTDKHAENLLSQLRRILQQISPKMHSPHHEITLLSTEDYHQLIQSWNATKLPYPYKTTIHRLFEEQVSKTPHNIALVINQEQLTYQELNDAANQMAWFLRFEISSTKLIPICFEHSFEMVITILAVLKAGAAYVPIDPSYPIARINTILQDTDSPFLFTSSQLATSLKTAIPSKIQIIAVNESLYGNHSADNLDDQSIATDLAYVIYTSGTTGSPKGVMITHQNVCNYLSSIIGNSAYTRGTIVDCSSSIAFDATVAVLFAPLISGRRVILYQESNKCETHLYLSHLKQHTIDLIRMTPSYLSALLTTQNHTLLASLTSCVRCLILGGEKANAADVRTWMTLHPNCSVINHYGPTETTVACAFFTMNDINEIMQFDTIPLGKPAHNHQFYVLDQFHHPVPIGVVGELYIGGAGVARGYLNQPVLTQSRFIPNPFKTKSQYSRLYKTGDLVRWQADGNIAYVGRNDFQVKIRGYRVELSEIEQVLLNHPHIQQCVVINREKNTLGTIDSQLVAYYVSTTQTISSKLKHHVENYLPEYMVPSVFVALDSLPLTINGKLDKTKLPEPNWSDDKSSNTGACDELESLLCIIWQETLGIKQVGIHDDFFRLGGHSILAVHLSHRISQRTGRHVSVADIFNYKTIFALCNLLRMGENVIAIEPIAGNIAPLSYAQERLWFIEQYEGGTDTYHIPLLLAIENNIDISALAQALQEIVKRHEVLRTVFVQNEQGFYHQQVQDQSFDISHQESDKSNFDLKRQEFLQKHFQLTHDYPIRACVFHLSDQDMQFLMVVFHHAAFDAWSKNIFLAELDYFYNSIAGNASQPLLPPLRIQYKDFSVWQRNIITKQLTTLLSYWQTRLEGYEPLAFPIDYTRPTKIDYQGDSVHLPLSEALSLQLKKLAASERVTLYTVLLTGFSIILSKYTGQYDLIIGTPTANRQHAEIAGLIGFFVNLLPLRIQIKAENSFLECLHLIHDYVISAQYHQDLPFAKLIEHLAIERETSRHPLFQILFNLEYQESKVNSIFTDKTITTENDYRRSKLDLSVSVQDRGNNLFITFQYATSLFKRDTITRFAAHFEKVLSAMMESMNNHVGTHSVLSPAEYQKIVYDWNATERAYPNTKTIHQLFEEQVEKTPYNIAIIFENRQLTYKELNERANQLANVIIKYENNNKLIAVCLERSIDLIVSLFAILKAGGAYVPLEPHYPCDRIRFILNDTQSALLLTQSTLITYLEPACPPHTKCLAVDQEQYQDEYQHNLINDTRPDDLAYIIYTSGTSGQPKGVMVQHRGLCNIVHHIPKQLYLNEASRVLQFASIAFDASALQIFNALTIGAQLFIVPESMRKDADALGHFLKENKISYAGMPPALLGHLDPTAYPELNTLVVAGEASNSVLMAKWHAGRHLINAYGPTENTIGATLHEYEANDSTTNIGRPLANVKVYVLDQQLLPAPIGVIGELYIGGVGVARGYLNQPELTQSRFIHDPFETITRELESKARLYKTGDLVRWLPDGNLEFVGRNDFQVKIRGYRIELNEIEQVLLRYPSIQQCRVIVCEKRTLQQSNAQLVAYYVCTVPVTSNALKSYLESHLPTYMVPNVFMELELIPLTTNGKLDRNKLPEPRWVDDATSYSPATDEIESLLCTIWQDALGVEQVGIHDDFFRLGGHSILAVHVSHRMSQATHRHIAVADLFKHKTIAGLCNLLRTGEHLIDIEPITGNTAPLSFAQERLWFIEQYEGGTDAYHIPMLFQLNPAIDISALKRALQDIIRRHAILRTIFIQDEQGAYQQKVNDDPLNIIYQEVNEAEFSLQENGLINIPFDLSTEYPIRIGIYHLLDNNKQLLLVIFHHSAFDAWSRPIFLAELTHFYQQATNDHTLQNLIPLSVQYLDFAIWQREMLVKRLEILTIYWQTKLKDHESLAFPTDYSRPIMMDYRGDSISTELSASLLNQLHALSTINHVTLHTVLLGGFALALSKYSNQTDVLIGTPVVNRQHPQLNNLIGLFINSLPLRIHVHTDIMLTHYLEAIQNTVIDAQLHQDLPFEQLLNSLNLVRDTSKHPLFQIMFTVAQDNTVTTGKEHWIPIAVDTNHQTAKFDLAVSIQLTEHNARLSIQYATALFDRDTIVRFLYHYEHLLHEIVKNPKKTIEQYQMLSPVEYQQMVQDWNATSTIYPKTKTIQQLFDVQVNMRPHSIALVFEDKLITYRELDRESNQLAHHIRSHYQGNIQPDSLIGLCVERSLDMLIGILGIIKAGAAYVPIDPHYPESQIKFIIEDTECQLLLTQQALRHLFDEFPIENLICLDEKPHRSKAFSALPITSKSTDLAYVMYTSGTTGVPKGVMIEHRSVICLLHSTLCDDIDFTAKGTLWTNLTFDVSVYEIFSILLNGGELHILPEAIKLDIEKLFHYIIQHQISSIYLPPFFVKQISEYLLHQVGPVSIRKVLLGVEPIMADDLTGFIAKDIAITNAYGPTETTVSSTAYPVKSIQHLQHKALPIGKALENETIYLLDKNLSPVPIGVIGEITIGGDGVARGYWKQPLLTRERFITNPFETHTQHKNYLYKTGDLARWLPDGNLAYVGRSDFQVKINGIRVELSAIEQAIMLYEGVDHCVVLKKKNGIDLEQRQYLVAYYTGQKIDDNSLRNHLSAKFPDYMIPTVLIYLPELPFNTNGKLNRDALPAPDYQIQDFSFVAPRHEMDAAACSIWQECLKITKIGIRDDFFALGGDSITSIQVISKLRYANINCTIKDIFQCRTVERLVDHVLLQDTMTQSLAEQGVLKGSFGLLPIQQWFFEQNYPAPNHWNQAFLVRVPHLSIEHLTSVLPQWINRHDMLRVRFIKNAENRWEQCYAQSQPIYTIKRFSQSNLSNTNENLITQFNQWQSELNIESGTLWQLAYIDGYTDNSARLFFTAHHLILDTISWKILVDDLKRVYFNQPLAAKTSSYRQWQHAIEQYALNNASELDFWCKQIDNAPISLPCAPHTSETLILDKELTAQLLKEANRAYHTKIDDLLLTALLYALLQITGHEQHAISLEGHGRELTDNSLDVSETVGWFTALYPILLSVETDLPETIKNIKDRIRDVPNKGIGYGALRYMHSQLADTKLPRIYFNYLGQFNTSEKPWSLVAENTGSSIHPDNIYDFIALINACVINGKLHINFGFTLQAEQRQQLLSFFKAKLIDIADHCLHQVSNQELLYTRGDFKTVKSEADLFGLPIFHNPISHYHSFEMTNIQKAYALGRLKQFEIGNVANHVYTEFSFNQLDVTKLEIALNRLIAAYPELRTVFDINNLTQRYLPLEDTDYYKIPIENVDKPYYKDALIPIRNMYSHVIYDVSVFPLFHFRVTQFQNRSVLHISVDLLLLDAQARMKFFTAVTHLYQQDHYQIPKRAISFRDYQIYMGLLKSSAWYATDKKYWHEKIVGLPLRPKLLLLRDPRSVEHPLFKLSKRSIAAPLWKRFKQKADQHGVSYSSVLLSLYGLVISRYSESSDFLITMTLFNRYGIHPDVNNLWGDFTSTNLFGFSRKSGSAIDFFRYTHEVLWNDISHALYTGLDVARDLMALHQLDPTIAVSPIVFTCVVGDTQHRAQTLPYFIDTNENVDERYWIGQTSQAWIDLQATERDGCFSSGWLYVSQLFADGFIDALNDSYCNLITYLAEHDWDVALPSIKLSTSEYSLINYANTTAYEVNTNTLVTLVMDKVHQRGQAKAVIDVNGSHDYRTLERKAQQLAYILHTEYKIRHQLIAILCEKSVNQVIATLGVMTAGAAYLPLNVEWPIGRINDILIEGHVTHVLVSEAQWHIIKETDLINHYQIHIIEKLAATTNQNPFFSINISPDDAAYVIFTSGSTGKPKGVCISHAGAVNTIVSVNERFAINQDDVVLALSELSFDLSVYDLFGTLAAGGIIVFPDQSLAKEPTHWFSLIKQHNVTVWNSVPQLMRLLLDNTNSDITCLRLVLLSGDWVPVPLVSEVKALPSKPTVVSLGGATEASIWSIWYEIHDTSFLNTIPYGLPMPNQNVYVLNAFGEHCPIGVAGEIHLGGHGLALDYWQDPEKTLQRFIEHADLGRLYKTGDLGKWHASGVIEFLGRLDNQVKRNGNRIELDEIAAKLIQLNGIDNAIVRIHDDRLIAYLVSTDFKSNYPDGLDIEQFKLSKKGIRTDLATTYVLEPGILHESDYRMRKSYRQFSTHKLPDNIKLLPDNKSRGIPTSQMRTAQELARLLSLLSARQLPDKILPKYIYPSAGSAYAVQCYVHIPEAFDTLKPGCYYYHPILNTLQHTIDRPLKSNYCLELVAYRPAIETLYGKDWLRMAYLETGHITYLLTDILEQQGVGYAVSLNSISNNENNYQSLALLDLNTTHYHGVLTNQLNTILMRRQDESFIQDTNQRFDLSKQTITMQTSEAGNILKSAQAFVVIEGKQHNGASWFAAGFQAQHYMQYWQIHQLAYCPLGLRPDENAIYTLALGIMRSEDKLIAESHASGPTLSDAVLSALSQHLPCYMLPQIFVTLDTLPLSANGKINFNALPTPDITSDTEAYVPPTTKLQKALCTVWQEVLALKKVGIQDDFFRIGGDSILSIYVTTKLRQLGIDCEVIAIFQFRCIERIATHIEEKLTHEKIIDTPENNSIHANISDGLLERLQSQYKNNSTRENTIG